MRLSFVTITLYFTPLTFHSTVVFFPFLIPFSISEEFFLITVLIMFFTDRVWPLNPGLTLKFPAVKETLNILKEVIEDYTEQLSYSDDPDARVGHKTKTVDSSFFGYKTHIAMSDERIITAAIVTTGEKSDGKYSVLV